MKQYIIYVIALIISLTMTSCKTKEKITTSNDITYQHSTWNNHGLQRSMFTIFDTIDIIKFPTISNTTSNTDNGFADTETGKLQYRFIRHVGAMVTDSTEFQSTSTIHNEETKNSVTSKTRRQNNYNGLQYAVFYIVLGLVLIVVFRLKR